MRPVRYPQGIPAPYFACFRECGTKSRQFVQFEQSEASQCREIDLFVKVDPKKVVPQVHQRFVTPNRQLVIQAPRRRVVLLRGQNSRSHTKFQVARTPRRRV